MATPRRRHISSAEPAPSPKAEPAPSPKAEPASAPKADEQNWVPTGEILRRAHISRDYLRKLDRLGITKPVLISPGSKKPSPKRYDLGPTMAAIRQLAEKGRP